MLNNPVAFMFRRLNIAIVFLIGVNLFSISSLSAQDWLTAYNNSVALYNEADSEKALIEATRSEALYKKQYDIDHNNYRAILRQISIISYDLYQLKQGIYFAKTEVDSWRNTITVDEVIYVGALDILGVLYAANSQYDSAILVLQEAIRLAMSNSTYKPDELGLKQGHLADALYGSGNLNKSEIWFEKSLALLEQAEELPAEYLSFCYSYGKVANSLKHYHKAVPYLQTMLDYYPPEYDNQPEVIDALVELGKAETELTHYTSGESHLRKALGRILNDKSAEIYIRATKLLASNLERQGNHNEAERLLKEIGSEVEKGSNQAALLMANQATVLLNSGNFNGAVNLFDSALVIIKNNEPLDYITLANVSYNNAIAYKSLGNIEQSKELFWQAVESSPETSLIQQKARIASARILSVEGNKALATKILDEANFTKEFEWRDTERGSIYNELAGYYQNGGDFAKSEEFYKKALQAVPVKTSAQLYNNIAFNYVSLLQNNGNYTEAERLLVDIESELKSGDPALQFIFLQNTGSLYHAKGDLAKAENQYAKALQLAGSTYGESSNQYADILLRQATLAKDKGAYDLSEPIFKRALSLVDAKSTEAAAIYNNLGILYQLMGRLDEAEKQFESALTIYTNSPSSNHSDYILTEENLATLYSLKGDNDKALELLSHTVEKNKEVFGSQSPNYAISLHNYASLLQKFKRVGEAKILFEEALDIQKNSFGTNHPSYANTLHNLAILAADSKDYNEASRLMNEVIRIRGTLYDVNHPSYTAALFSRAVLMQQMNNFDAAKADFDNVSTLYLQQIIKYFPNLSESEKTAFYKKITPVFNRYKEFLLEYYVNYKKDEEVLGQLYNIQIATKAILLNSVNKTRDRILSSGDTQLINNFNEWRALKKQLVTYYTYSKSKLQEENINLNQFETLVNQKEKELSSGSEIFANEFDKQQIKWQDIQAKLSSEQVALELIRIERNSSEVLDSVTYIALGVSPGFTTPKLVIYPNGKILTEKYLKGYNNYIKFRKLDMHSYQVFWQPLTALTTGYKTAYLSPDGVFNKINANSLFDGKNNIYLNQEQNVQYISSTRDLLKEHKSNPIKDALLIADPFYPNSIKLTSNVQRSYNFGAISQLPATKVEVDYISSIMNEDSWNVKVLSSKEARKQTIINSSPKLLHIAVHGFFLTENKSSQNKFLDNPLFRSGLLLAGAGSNDVTTDNDGILTAYEVMNMNLEQTDLVVLSACETALGDVQNGEGVYGLQRAFIVAGASTLIMSLWKVDDAATQKLMSLFYKYWLSGVDKHEALQKAQIEIQKEYNYPYFWGAFIMIGI